VKSLPATVCRMPAYCSVTSTPSRQRLCVAGLQALRGSAAEVSAEAKARVQVLHARLNRLPLARDIERQKRAIEVRRWLPA
jgi:hypothetical protein